MIQSPLCSTVPSGLTRSSPPDPVRRLRLGALDRALVVPRLELRLGALDLADVPGRDARLARLGALLRPPVLRPPPELRLGALLRPPPELRPLLPPRPDDPPPLRLGALDRLGGLLRLGALDRLAALLRL